MLKIGQEEMKRSPLQYSGDQNNSLILLLIDDILLIFNKVVSF